MISTVVRLALMAYLLVVAWPHVGWAAGVLLTLNAIACEIFAFVIRARFR